LIDENKDIKYFDKDTMTVNDYLHCKKMNKEWKDNLTIPLSIAMSRLFSLLNNSLK